MKYECICVWRDMMNGGRVGRLTSEFGFCARPQTQLLSFVIHDPASTRSCTPSHSSSPPLRHGELRTLRPPSQHPPSCTCARARTHTHLPLPPSTRSCTPSHLHSRMWSAMLKRLSGPAWRSCERVRPVFLVGGVRELWTFSGGLSCVSIYILY